MSTLSGKPRGPIDLSSYVSQRARERQENRNENRQEDRQENRQEPGWEPGQGLDQESAGDVLRSPYAPKLVRDLDAVDTPAGSAPSTQPDIAPSAASSADPGDDGNAAPLQHEEHTAPLLPDEAGEHVVSTQANLAFESPDQLSFASENFDPDRSQRGAAASWHVADAGAQAPIQPDAGESADDPMDPM